MGSNRLVFLFFFFVLVEKDAFVLCRIFQKSGSGPKNGEQYGAPFVEEEWENDELVMVPGGEARGEEAADDDAFLEANDIDQVRDPSHYAMHISEYILGCRIFVLCPI